MELQVNAGQLVLTCNSHFRIEHPECRFISIVNNTPCPIKTARVRFSFTKMAFKDCQLPGKIFIYKDGGITARSSADIKMKLDAIPQLNLSLPLLLNKDALHICFTTQQDCQVVMKEFNQTSSCDHFSVGVIHCCSIHAQLVAANAPLS